MGKSKRITLTQEQARSAYGQRLIHQILALSHDGEISIEEVTTLHKVLRSSPAEFNAVPFLRAITSSILADGAIDATEAYELRRAMERVVPKVVRMRLSELLANIGLPTLGEDEPSDSGASRSWRNDPITARQSEFIRDLGGVPHERMTKGAASALIDQLIERRAPTVRQQMVLRFFDRLDLMSTTKEEVSVWLDGLFTTHEEYERAWHVFKAGIGDDGSIRNPSIVPIGAYRNYLRQRPSKKSSAPTSGLRQIAVGLVVIIALALVIVFAFR